jgi:uncharacterized protein with HEPN domain
MSKRNDDMYFRHVLECIADVRTFTAGKLDTYHTNSETWHAVIRVLQIMAESLTRISEPTKQQMTGIKKWRDIKDFRNLLVHDYLGDTDPEIIRLVITNELPIVEIEINRMLMQRKEQS